MRSKEDAPDLARDVSPIFHSDDNTVPFLIAHGALDPVVPVNRLAQHSSDVGPSPRMSSSRYEKNPDLAQGRPDR